MNSQRLFLKRNGDSDKGSGEKTGPTGQRCIWTVFAWIEFCAKHLTYVWRDRKTERQMDEQTDGRTDEQTDETTE